MTMHSSDHVVLFEVQAAEARDAGRLGPEAAVVLRSALAMGSTTKVGAPTDSTSLRHRLPDSAPEGLPS